jgi:hypothetical protein
MLCETSKQAINMSAHQDGGIQEIIGTEAASAVQQV